MAITGVLDKIDEGRAEIPRNSGPIGLYLSQYGVGKGRASETLPSSPAAQWCDGSLLGPVTLFPITPLHEPAAGGGAGPRSSLVAASDTSGCLFSVTLWRRGRSANRLARLWRN